MTQSNDKTTVKFELPKVEELGADFNVTNLRADKGTGALVPVAPPAHLAAGGYVEAYETAPDCYLLVMDDRQTLVYHSPDGEMELGALGDTLCTLVADGPNTLRALTRSGHEWLSRESADGPWHLHGALTLQQLAVRFEAGTTQWVQEYTPAFTLRDEYPRQSGMLSQADSVTAGRAVLTAFASIRSRARERGMAVQPRLMGWRLLDSNGVVLLETGPQWVAGTSGFQGTGAVTAQVLTDDAGKFNRVGATAVGAFVWDPQVQIKVGEWLGDFWRTHAAVMEVLASEPMDPMADAGEEASAWMNPVSSAAASLTIYAPGALADHGRLPDAILDSWPQCARVVARIEHPLAQGERSVSITLADGSEAVKGVAGTAADVPAELTGNGRFTAGVAYRTGPMMVYGDVTELPADAIPTPFSLAATVESEGFDVRQQSVGYDPERGVQTVGYASAARPLTFPPLIVWPDAQATELRLHVEGQMVTLPLTPHRSGRWAVWTATQWHDWTPTYAARAWHRELTTARPRDRPGLLLLARQEQPFTAVHAVEASPGRFLRLSGAVGSSGGWTFGRSHLIGWATDGVYSLSISHSPGRISAALLTEPGIGRKDALAVTPSALYYATSRGRLLRRCGARVTELPVAVEAAAVGWEPRRGELWVADAEGAVTVLTADDRCYRRSDVTVTGFVQSPHALLLIDAAGRLRDATAEHTAADRVAVKYHRRLPLYTRSERVEWDVEAPAATMNLGLKVDRGTATGAIAALTLRVDGAVPEPIRALYYSPGRPWLTVEASGTMHPQSRLRSITVR